MSKFIESLKEVLNEKTLQISLIGAILFFLLSQPGTYEFVRKNVKSVSSMVGFDVSLEGNNLIILHAIVFAILLTLSTNYILEPLFYDNNGILK